MPGSPPMPAPDTDQDASHGPSVPLFPPQDQTALTTGPAVSGATHRLGPYSARRSSVIRSIAQTLHASLRELLLPPLPWRAPDFRIACSSGIEVGTKGESAQVRHVALNASITPQLSLP